MDRRDRIGGSEGEGKSGGVRSDPSGTSKGGHPSTDTSHAEGEEECPPFSMVGPGFGRDPTHPPPIPQVSILERARCSTRGTTPRSPLDPSPLSPVLDEASHHPPHVPFPSVSSVGPRPFPFGPFPSDPAEDRPWPPPMAATSAHGRPSSLIFSFYGFERTRFGLAMASFTRHVALGGASQARFSRGEGIERLQGTGRGPCARGKAASVQPVQSA